MNRLLQILIINLLLISCELIVRGAEWTTSNLGTFNWSSVSPGDTVTVNGNQSPVTLPSSASGTPANRITLNLSNATFIATNIANNASFLYCGDVHDLNIRGGTIACTDSGWNLGRTNNNIGLNLGELGACRNVSVIGMVVTNLSYRPGESAGDDESEGGTCFRFSGAVSNLTMAFCTGKMAVHGLIVFPSGQSHRVNIQSNWFEATAEAMSLQVNDKDFVGSNYVFEANIWTNNSAWNKTNSQGVYTSSILHNNGLRTSYSAQTAQFWTNTSGSYIYAPYGDPSQALKMTYPASGRITLTNTYGVLPDHWTAGSTNDIGFTNDFNFGLSYIGTGNPFVQTLVVRTNTVTLIGTPFSNVTAQVSKPVVGTNYGMVITRNLFYPDTKNMTAVYYTGDVNPVSEQGTIYLNNIVVWSDRCGGYQGIFSINGWHTILANNTVTNLSLTAYPFPGVVVISSPVKMFNNLFINCQNIAYPATSPWGNGGRDYNFNEGADYNHYSAFSEWFVTGGGWPNLFWNNALGGYWQYPQDEFHTETNALSLNLRFALTSTNNALGTNGAAILSAAGMALPIPDFDGNPRPASTPWTVGAFELSTYTGTPPTITSQPTGSTGLTNATLTASTAATGDAPITYYAYTNSVFYGLSSDIQAVLGTAGTISAYFIASNAVGTATSSTATLTWTNGLPVQPVTAFRARLK